MANFGVAKAFRALQGKGKMWHPLSKLSCHVKLALSERRGILQELQKGTELGR